MSSSRSDPANSCFSSSGSLGLTATPIEPDQYRCDSCQSSLRQVNCRRLKRENIWPPVGHLTETVYTHRNTNVSHKHTARSPGAHRKSQRRDRIRVTAADFSLFQTKQHHRSVTFTSAASPPPLRPVV